MSSLFNNKKACQPEEFKEQFQEIKELICLEKILQLFKIIPNKKAKHVANFAPKWFNYNGKSQMSKISTEVELAFFLEISFSVSKWVHI